MKTVRSILISAIAALGLAACGSNRPSTEEAQAAIGATFTQVSSGSMTVIGYRDFTLSNCRNAAPSEGVICDLGGEVVLNVSGTELVRPIVEPVRFSKSNGIWTAHRP
ncbi:hypothetical protein [Stenotrophomonas maltophilia]|uniref:hypothetical protein n=1 Tax=Stenotrophomonas maltophilia TaxID=40324 RepID=UPI0007F8FA95|nr:hypothetical protein [Stenotrophomonas maltophilia]OBU65913.1 hypothetical protein A9J40_11770 [Stenotrophomonas maltophilia]